MRNSKRVEDSATKEEKMYKNSGTLPNRAHIGYGTRLVIAIVAFVIVFGIGLFLLSKSFEQKDYRTVYTENQNLDYRVYLKESDYYGEYLGKGSRYIASLIDKITVDFNYDFQIKEDIPVDFTYKIMGDLLIDSPGNSKPYLEETYTLLEGKVGTTENNKFSIRQPIELDYNYYNTRANTFKSKYSVDTESSLKVYLVVEKKSNDEKVEIQDTKEMSLIIPLSERSFEISFTSDEPGTKEVGESELTYNGAILVATVAFFFASLVVLTKIISLLMLLSRKKTPYDKYVAKILKDYDRLIVETSTVPDFAECKIMKIKQFDELLDVRDNLKLPVIYCEVVKHQKGYFYIKDHNDLYILIIKNTDLE